MNTELLKSKLLEAAFNGSLTHADTSKWENVNLNDVCEFDSGYAFASGDYKTEGTPLVRISNIQNNEIDLSDAVCIQGEYPEQFIIHRGDLLIAMSGATTGKMGVYNLDKKAYLNQRVGKIRIKDEQIILPKYRNFFFQNQTDNILRLASGSAQPNISGKMILSLTVPLPPLAEQQRIVDALEECFVYIDAAASAKQNLFKSAYLLRGKILEDAISGTLINADTSTWTLMTLNDLFKITTGKKDANFGDRNGEYEFFTCSNTPLKSKTYSYDGDYLIMPGNGANIGQVRHYTGKFEAYQRTYLMQAIQPVNLDYVKFHLENGWAKYNEDKIFGAATPYIKLGNLTSYPILLPPLAEQQRIVAKIEELFAEIDKLK